MNIISTDIDKLLTFQPTPCSERFPQNLSYNHLTGMISETIGGMEKLESLDLSNNMLFREILENMATLSFLGYLNLSCNNFTRQIPIGT